MLEDIANFIEGALLVVPLAIPYLALSKYLNWLEKYGEPTFSNSQVLNRNEVRPYLDHVLDHYNLDKSKFKHAFSKTAYNGIYSARSKRFKGKQILLFNLEQIPHITKKLIHHEVRHYVNGDQKYDPANTSNYILKTLFWTHYLFVQEPRVINQTVHEEI